MQEPEVRKLGDFGTKIRLERGEIALHTDHEGMQRARVRHCSVLDQLGKQHLTQIQVSAGEQLYKDWYYGVATRDSVGVQQYQPKAGAMVGYKASDYTNGQMDAWNAYHAAVRCLEGLGRHLIEGVCCHNHTPKAIERQFNLPQQYGINRLREALDTLAKHYGMVG